MNTQSRTVEEWQRRVGDEVRSARIDAGLDQETLAARADIGLTPLRRLEAGRGSSLGTLIRVVRCLGRTDWLDGLSPDITVSPLQMLRSRRRDQPRRRVSRPRHREDD